MTADHQVEGPERRCLRWVGRFARGGKNVDMTSTADEVETTRQSRHMVTLFAALVVALGWTGVFDPHEVPFDTTSSEAQLPPLAGAVSATVPSALAFVDPMVLTPPARSEPEVVVAADADVEPEATQAAPEAVPEVSPPEEPPVVEFEASLPAPVVPEDSFFPGEPVPDEGEDAADGAVEVAAEPPVYENTSTFAVVRNAVIFEDDFDDVGDWRMFEQIIGSRPDCYGERLADHRSSADPVDPWLELTANHAASDLTNHPILGRRLPDEPVSGLHRLQVDARIEAGSEDSLQVGPEFSVQNTVRAESGAHVTQTFGMQYEAREGTHHWNLWSAFGDEIGWRRIHTAALVPGEWYELSLVFDTGTGEYTELSVVGPGGFTLLFDGVHSLWQDKSFHEEAVWVTVEAENLFTCDDPQVRTATVHYDSFLYERLG